jgi:hypothetical protein
MFSYSAADMDPFFGSRSEADGYSQVGIFEISL